MHKGQSQAFCLGVIGVHTVEYVGGLVKLARSDISGDQNASASLIADGSLFIGFYQCNRIGPAPTFEKQLCIIKQNLRLCGGNSADDGVPEKLQAASYLGSVPEGMGQHI